MRSVADLHRLYEARRLEHSADGALMVDLALAYDGGEVVRIAEIDRTSESSSPNLVAQGIDQYARYSASARPEVESFPLRPSIASSVANAAKRVRVVKGWHENSHMPLADYLRFRYYFGYGAMPAVIRPDPRDHAVPRWEARTPMGVLPGPRDLPYSPVVPDCFVVTQQSARWVHDNYGIDFDKTPPDALLEVVEYTDAEQTTLFATGFTGPDAPTRAPDSLNAFGLGTYGGYWSERGNHIEHLGSRNDGRWLITLSSTPNPAGMCLVSCPGVISLSKTSGFVNGILNRSRLHARVLALTTLGVTKGILPDEWIEEDPNGSGVEIVTEANGLRGKRGMIRGGKLNVIQLNPSYLTFQYLDRLESYSRSESGVTSSLGGESGENIRTRARGEALDSMVIDPRVEEAHQIMQVAKEHEHRLAIAYAKAVGRSRPVSVYVPGRKSAGLETYVASDLFDTDQTQVRYPVPGVNTSGLLIGAGQSLGTGMMSQAEARRLNPLVEDPRQTGIDIRTEALEQQATAFLSMVLESAPEEYAMAIRLTRQGLAIEDVIERVQRAVQERQATTGEPGTPEGPGIPGSPEAQPGLGAPGVADEPAPVIGEPAPSARNLASLFTAVRRPAMAIPAERAG